MWGVMLRTAIHFVEIYRSSKLCGVVKRPDHWSHCGDNMYLVTFRSSLFTYPFILFFITFQNLDPHWILPTHRKQQIRWLHLAFHLWILFGHGRRVLCSTPATLFLSISLVIQIRLLPTQKRWHELMACTNSSAIMDNCLKSWRRWHCSWSIWFGHSDCSVAPSVNCPSVVTMLV